MTDLPPYPEGFEPPAGYPPPSDASPPVVQPPAYPSPPGYAAPPGYPPAAPYYPAPGGFAPYPSYGYQVPGGPQMYDVTGFGSDPLVTPPGEGFSGWWSRLWKTFARSWRPLALILVLTTGVPGVVFGLAIAGPAKNLTTHLQQFQQLQQQDPTTPVPDDLLSGVGRLYAILGIYLLVFLIFGAVGWTASMWTITKQATGEPAPFGRALGYGLKNLPRVGGWLILYFLMVIVGSACCVLPGLYFGVAGSLIVPLVIFSRGSISDSFRMVNRNFGAVLGRFATIYGLTIGIGLVVFLVSSIAGSAGTGLSTTGIVILETLTTIIMIPTTMVLIIGIALTFAEMRAKEMLTTTPMLNQAL